MCMLASLRGRMLLSGEILYQDEIHEYIKRLLKGPINLFNVRLRLVRNDGERWKHKTACRWSHKRCWMQEFINTLF